MKKISKNMYDACEYKVNNPQISLTQVGTMFGVERHGLKNHLSDYKNYSYFKENYYYYLTQEELEPVLYFLKNSTTTLKDVTKKYGIKDETLKRRLFVIGQPYEKRFKRKFNRLAFKEIKTEEDAYWLGFILADGYINEDRNFLQIKLAQKDEEHLEKFAKYMGEDKNIIKHEIGGAYTRDNVCSSIKFSSKELVQNLKQYGLHQAKSGKEKPIQFDNLNLKIPYIRGMIDGDGHIQDGYFKYVGSIESCQYLKDFFSQYYIFKQNCKYIYKHGTIFSFEIRSEKVNSIIKMIYNDATIYLDRKYKIIQNFIN